MVKLKVSYETQGELEKVIRLLGITPKIIRIQPEKGKYKRAYINLIDLENIEILPSENE